MIGLGDTLTLAITKTRTRKVRTIFTIIVAGLLFSMILTILLVTQGFFQGAERLNKQAMTGRYIINAVPAFSFTTSAGNPYADSEAVAKAQRLYDARITAMKAEAKRLGIEFDPSSEPKPYVIGDPAIGEKVLNNDSPIGREMMAEVDARRNPQMTLDRLKKIAAPYQPTAFYQTFTVRPKDGTMTEMVGGKEAFEYNTAKSRNAMTGAPVDVQDVTLAPQALVSLYVLRDHGWTPASGTVPVVVTQKRAAQLLEFAMPTGSVSAKQKLDYMQQLRQKAKGLTFSVCYRNTVSQEQIAQAQMVAKDIANNKNNPNYMKPEVIYGLPDPAACAPAPVLSDKRSSADKALAVKQNEFKRQFGAVVDADQRKITYQVVGIAPNSMYDSTSFSLGIGSMVSSMLASQTFRFAIPEELYNQLPDKAALDTVFAKNPGGAGTSYDFMGGMGAVYAEFANADQARSFSKNESCTYSFSGECLPKDKQVMLNPFGSNSLGIADAKKGVSQFLFWLTVVIVGLAAVIASLTIGRMIADGRRETAVFRAIGFKRFDITQIYVAYTLLICLGIVAMSTLIALLIASLLDAAWWVDITSEAQLALGLSGSNDAIRLVGFSPEFAGVILAIFVSGLVGMALPLIRNIRRNPIRDMRDE
ncbi:MAG: ABC transporter permease [Candidatus Saccharimonas sp.]